MGRESDSDAEVAAALSDELRNGGQASRVTVRWLRDRFGRERLTAAGREQIAEALNRAGIAFEPDLDGVSLDDEIKLRLVDRPLDLARWRRLLLNTGSRAWKVTVALLSLLGTLVGLYAFFHERLSKPPLERLSGDFNLAVAPFTVRAVDEDADAIHEGEQLARQVRTSLTANLNRGPRRAGVIFDIAPPPALEPVRGGTPEERAAAAERSARRLNADMLVYGTVRVEENRTVVAPSFYTSGRALANAEELVGAHRLGAPIDVTGSVADSVAARIDARRLLAARTRTLSDFVVGLSHFEQRDYAAARRWFREAELTARSAGAREVIYLFLGHAAGRAGDLTRAQHFYARALDLDPNYARAQFGVAEVEYQRAHHGCQRGDADKAGLHAALRGFMKVERQYQPHGALLKIRARFNRARVLLCLSQAEIEPRWAEADALFREVVRAYESGESRLRDEASEAQGYIGVIQLPSGREEAPDRNLRGAAAHYERALQLSLDPDRQAVFLEMLGFIYGKLGRIPAADRAYRRAAQLDRDPGDRQRYEQARRELWER